MIQEHDKKIVSGLTAQGDRLAVIHSGYRPGTSKVYAYLMTNSLYDPERFIDL